MTVHSTKLDRINPVSLCEPSHFFFTFFLSFVTFHHLPGSLDFDARCEMVNFINLLRVQDDELFISRDAVHKKKLEKEEVNSLFKIKHLKLVQCE